MDRMAEDRGGVSNLKNYKPSTRPYQPRYTETTGTYHVERVSQIWLSFFYGRVIRGVLFGSFILVIFTMMCGGASQAAIETAMEIFFYGCLIGAGVLMVYGVYRICRRPQGRGY